MATRFRLGMIALALAGISATGAVQTPDSAERFARVRLVVTTTAAAAAVTVGDARVASYISSVLDGPPAVSVSRTGGTLQLSRNVAGRSAEASFDIILADVAPGRSVAWNVTADAKNETQIEVYSLGDSNGARLVDRSPTPHRSSARRIGRK